jgi:hypothetical protein
MPLHAREAAWHGVVESATMISPARNCDGDEHGGDGGDASATQIGARHSP